MTRAKTANHIADFLVEIGISTCFMVTGGMAMHLNSAIALNPKINTIFLHNEQSCAMAAEGHYRSSGKIAAVCVTAGPGVLNSLNGVFGGYTDSIPMLIVSGQSKVETTRLGTKQFSLRQLGDQELDTGAMVTPIVKAYHLITESNKIDDVFDEVFNQIFFGRGGPVWIDVPVDIQGQQVKSSWQKPKNALEENIDQYQDLHIDDFFNLLINAKRPLILCGTGVKFSKTSEQIKRLSLSLGVPVQTCWSHDTFETSFQNFAGRPGTIGTRDANLIQQASDLVVVLGSRLNVRQISYNLKSFSRDKTVIQVDIDKNELNKPFPNIDVKINACLTKWVPAVLARIPSVDMPHKWEGWRSAISKTMEKYAPKRSDYPTSTSSINPYHLFFALNNLELKNTIFICGDATATIVPFQVLAIQDGMQLISNSGSASMGYDLPASIGAAIANPNTNVVCLAGDGSIMMNLQELSYVKHLKNLKLIIIDNNGYLSIKQTQNNFFNESFGTSPENGLYFPDFAKVLRGFEIPNRTLQQSDSIDEDLSQLFGKAFQALIVKVDEQQEFSPRLKSKIVHGKISTPELDEMFPFLTKQELIQAQKTLKKCKQKN